jgi:hypothetical protein
MPGECRFFFGGSQKVPTFLDIVNQMRRDAQTAIRGGEALSSDGVFWPVISKAIL